MASQSITASIIPEIVYQPQKLVPKVVVPQGPDAWKSREILGRVVDGYEEEGPVDFRIGDVVFGIKINSLYDEENLRLAMKLLGSGMNEGVVFGEVGTRAYNQMATEGKKDCKNIVHHVLGEYDTLRKIIGMDKGMRVEGVCSRCYPCPIPFIHYG